VIAAVSLLLIFAVSFFLIRTAAIALKLTGLPDQAARFQAMSALTGTGFTTTEAELITNYPIRRKIIAGLMIAGNLGIVSVLSTTMISFVRVDAQFQAIMAQIAWMVGLTIMFFIVMLNPVVDRAMCGLIKKGLEKFTFLGRRRYSRLLQLGEELSVSEHQFFADKAVSAQWLQDNSDGLSILTVRRATGKTEVFSPAMKDIQRGDTLILFGSDAAQDGFITPQ